MTVEYVVHGDVAVVALNNPPVNGLGFATRQAIVAGVGRAEADPLVRAIVLTGSGKAFSSGADIREFGSPKAFQEPTLTSVIEAVERCSKPVVAALHTLAMGGGLELALGCHYRIAAPGCVVSMPEVKLGIIPGAGGTQRLPRAIGVEAALNMIVSGDPVKCELLARLPGQKLLDKLAATPASLADEAQALARDVAARHANGSNLPLLRDLSCAHPQGEGYFQFARNMVQGMAKNFPAPVKCVDAVEAATRLKFNDGLKRETEIFLQLMWTPESRALRHIFIAERATSKIPDVPEDTPQRVVQSVAVIGAGTMGGGISMNFLNAGIPVTLLETQQEALARGLATIRKNYEARVRKGKLDPLEFERRMALLTGTLSFDDIKTADLVIEAVFEDMAIKEQVFKRLDETVKQGAILASNTSTLDLDRIAGFTRRPQDVIGLHFFSPANVMKLLEVVRGKRTGNDVLATAIALAKKIKKTPVVSGVCDGFIGNRMLGPYSRQAMALLEEGATPQHIDKAVEDFGFAMGPLRVSDLAGNDIGWAVRKRKAAEHPGRRPEAAIADRLCELGRFGQKTGAGWYDYRAGVREPLTSQVVSELIDAHRLARGIAPRKITDEEIVQRLVYALVNEGARILEDGIASKAGDIDMVYLLGYGFPTHRGGPMLYADTVGLPNVLRSMARFANASPEDAGDWKPAPLLSRLAAEGKSFN